MATNPLVSLIPIPSESRNYIRAFNSFLVFMLKMLPIALIISGIFGYLFYKKEKSKPINYTAKLSFIESQKINNSTPIGGGANLNLFANTGSGAEAGSTLGDIIKSDVILSKALFKPLSATNNEMLINYYLKKYDSLKYQDLKFNHPTLDSMSEDQTRLYNQLKAKLINPPNNIFRFSSDQVSQMVVETDDELLSYSLINNIFDSISEFYEENSNESYNENFRTLIHSRDSVFSELKKNQNRLAQYQTMSGFDKLPTQELVSQQLQQEINFNQNLYGQYYKQIETFKLQNKNKQPVFRKLDVPILPLSMSHNNETKQAIIGSLVGFFVGLFFIILIYLTIVSRQLYLKAKYQDAE